MRSKRFVFSANFTCGSIAFCSPSIHSWDYVTNSSLAADPACNDTAVLITVCLELFLSACIIAGNTLILYIMNTSPCFRNPQGVFKTSLAASDLLVGAIVLPSASCSKGYVMFKSLGRNHLDYFRSTQNTAWSISLGMLFTICIFASLLSLMLLAIDRMLAVLWPFKYSQGPLMTKRRAKILVAATWVLAVFVSIMPLGDATRFAYQLDYMTMSRMLTIKPDFKHTPTGTSVHGVFFLVLIFILPYVIVVAITTITWIKFVYDRMTPCNIASKSSSDNTTVSNTSSPAGQPLNKEVERVTLTIFIMVAVFTVCVLPFLAAQMENLVLSQHNLGDMTSQSRGCNPVLYLVSVELLFLNSLSNFVIYNLRNKFFRMELKKMLTRVRRCHATDVQCC